MIRRFVTPPSLPAIIRPGPADRTEHIATQDKRANSSKAFVCHRVVDSGLTVFVAVHFAPDPGVEQPVHQFGAANSKRILEILIWPGTKAVDGDCEALNFQSRHYP